VTGSTYTATILMGSGVRVSP